MDDTMLGLVGLGSPKFFKSYTSIYIYINIEVFNIWPKIDILAPLQKIFTNRTMQPQKKKLLANLLRNCLNMISLSLSLSLSFSNLLWQRLYPFLIFLKPSLTFSFLLCALRLSLIILLSLSLSLSLSQLW